MILSGLLWKNRQLESNYRHLRSKRLSRCTYVSFRSCYLCGLFGLFEHTFGQFVDCHFHVNWILIIWTWIKQIDWRVLLIFSNTYNEIEKESDQIWKFQRYNLTYEYFYKPILVPPFILLYYIMYLLILLVGAVVLGVCAKDSAMYKRFSKSVFYRITLKFKKGFRKLNRVKSILTNQLNELFIVILNKKEPLLTWKTKSKTWYFGNRTFLTSTMI